MTQEELEQLAAAISDRLAPYHKDVLSIDEAAQYTGMKKSTLYKLTSTRMIPHYKPNGKICFFRRTELEDWMTSFPIATNADLDTKAIIYCDQHKRTYK